MAKGGVPVSDVLQASKGTMQKQFYVVFTRPVKGIEPVLKHLEEHLKFQVDLEKRGIMFGAGPFWDDDEATWSGEGMVIIRAESLAAAKAIAEMDPMHKSGARTFEVRPWLLNEGNITVHLTFSDKKYRLE